MSFLNAFKKQFFTTLKDRDVIVLLLAAPIILILWFGGVYYQSYVDDIPIAVLDEDQSSLSRMIIQQFSENDRFKITHYPVSKEELQQMINAKKVHMGLYLPHNFSKDVQNLQSSKALIIVDGTNIVVGNNAYAAAAAIIQTVSASVQMKTLQGKGMLPQISESMVLPFQFTDRTLYDPRMTYKNYLLFGYIAVFLQQIIISGVGISIVKDEESMKSNILQSVTVKILSAAVFALLSTSAAIMIVNTLFKVPIRGNLFEALLLCMIFILAVSGPAIILAAVTKDKIKLAHLSFMLSLPTFVSSGYIWPLDQMPEMLVKIIKSIWPLINFARPFDEMLIKGFPIEALGQNIKEMLLYTAFWLPISLWLLKRNYCEVGISKPEKENNNLKDCIELS
ncbi:MAG: ABC transporter permease [Bacillota bacterium]